jgi:hypothetical protein
MRRSSSAPRSGRDVVVGGVGTTLRLDGLGARLGQRRTTFEDDLPSRWQSHP